MGLAVFYGLDRLASTSRKQTSAMSMEDAASGGVFWVHISSFAVYNFLIVYLLLHRLGSSLEDLLLFFVAVALGWVMGM